MSSKNKIRIYRGGVVPSYGTYSATLPPMHLVDESAGVSFDGADVVVSGNNTVKRHPQRESIVEFRMNGPAFYGFVSRVVSERVTNPDTRRAAKSMVKAIQRLEALDTSNTAMGQLLGDLVDTFNEEEEPRDYVDWPDELKRSGLAKHDCNSLEAIQEFLSGDDED